MKKPIALILAILLLAGCAPAVYDGPTESAWVLTSQRTTYYYPVYGIETAGTTYAYDSLGNLVHVLSYENGELLRETKSRYDDRGNEIRRVVWDHSGWFSYPEFRTSNTFDEKNRLLTAVYRNGLGIKTGTGSHTYDEEANTVTWEGTYTSYTQYLNENGDPLRVLTVNHDNGTEMESLYEYDALGRNTRTVSYYDGALSSTLETSYDDQGRILEEVWWDPDGIIFHRNTLSYTENTQTALDPEGYKTVITYRPDGQMAKMEIYAPSVELERLTEYIYSQIQIPAKEE